MLNNIKSHNSYTCTTKTKKKTPKNQKNTKDGKCREISKRQQCLLNNIPLTSALIGYVFFLSRMQNLPKRQKRRVNLGGQLAFLWPGQLTVCCSKTEICKCVQMYKGRVVQIFLLTFYFTPDHCFSHYIYCISFATRFISHVTPLINVTS